VTEAGENNLQLRVLVTAANSPLAWDLRCRIRAGLVDFMQRSYPQFLPAMRAELRDYGGVPKRGDAPFADGSAA